MQKYQAPSHHVNSWICTGATDCTLIESGTRCQFGCWIGFRQMKHTIYAMHWLLVLDMDTIASAATGT